MALLQRKVAVAAAQQRNSSMAASSGAGTSLQPPGAAVAATAVTAATAATAAPTAMQERPLRAEQLSDLESSNAGMGSAVFHLGPSGASGEALSAETRRVR